MAYDNWKNASKVLEVVVFDKNGTKIPKEDWDAQLGDLAHWLPKMENPSEEFFVATIPAIRVGDEKPKEYVKLLFSHSWDANFALAVEALEFVDADNDPPANQPKNLVSTEEIVFPTEDWTASGKPTCREDGTRKAKVNFDNNDPSAPDNLQKVGVFWCWP
jgi:hypothetical protein